MILKRTKRSFNQTYDAFVTPLLTSVSSRCSCPNTALLIAGPHQAHLQREPLNGEPTYTVCSKHGVGFIFGLGLLSEMGGVVVGKEMTR